MSKKQTKKRKTLEELLEEALVPEEEQPYPVPENWVWVRMGALSKVVGGGTPKTSVAEYYEGGKIPWVTPADLSNHEDIYIDRGSRYITELGYKNSSTKLLPPNSLLLSSRAPIGYVAIARKELCTNQGFKSFTPSKAYLPHYGYWYLKFATNIILGFASGTTFQEISGSKAALIPLPLPPLSEQKRIVQRVESLLDKINEAKQLIEEAKETFANRRAAILAKAFRGELTKKWREENPDVEPADILLERIREEREKRGTNKKGKKKAQELPPIDPPYELPEGWKWVYLSELASFQNGLSKRSGKDGKPTVVLRLADVKGNKFSLENFREINLTEKEIEKYKVEENDILFIRVNGSIDIVGKAILYDLSQKVAYCDHLIRGSFNEKVNNKYILHFFSSSLVRNQILKRVVSSAGQNTISQQSLSSLIVPLPPIKEQLVITDILERLLENEDEVLQNCIDLQIKIDKIKQSILTKAFRGELGTNNPEEESAIELLKETLLEQVRPTTKKQEKRVQGELVF